MRLQEIRPDQFHYLQGTSYGELSEESQKRLLMESQAKEHQGRYFCLLLIWEEEEVVGAINLFGHGEKEISIGPEIKPSFRGRGFAAQAMELALDFVAGMGFTRAASEIREDNEASLALHKKLGFRVTREYVNKRGRAVVWMEREIQPLVE